jgi:hypothetical protein
MAPYFFIFGLASMFALNPINISKGLENILWILVIIFGTLFIGLRYEVGGDWLNYVNSYDKLSVIPIQEWFNLSRFDPGYLAIVLLCSTFDTGIIGVNIFCGLIVMSCLVFFARQQPLPWITIVAAIPFFIIGINMGTVRQGLALSIILVALTYVDKNVFRYCMWILFAMTFHKSAFLMLGLAFFKIRNKKALFGLIALIAILGLVGSQLDAVQILILAYVLDPDYQSDGALVRVLISLLPFIGALFFYKKLMSEYPDYWAYLLIGIAAFILVYMSFSLSTLVDRLAYYTIPLQLALWPRIIAAQDQPLMRAYFTISFIFGYFLMLYVWLAYANHSWAWLPYQIFWPGEYGVSPSSLCLEHSSGYC